MPTSQWQWFIGSLEDLKKHRQQTLRQEDDEEAHSEELEQRLDIPKDK